MEGEEMGKMMNVEGKLPSHSSPPFPSHIGRGGRGVTS